MRVAVIRRPMSLAIDGAANAQVIYPIDRATILTGSRFDLMVEFPGLAVSSRV